MNTMDVSIEKKVFNAYCDESCHLEHDHIPVMGFGLVSIENDSVRAIAKEMKELKRAAGCVGELKWTKVSPKNSGFYCDLVDYFFKCQALSFRALIVHDKGSLDHASYNEGSHDQFYYKMYYYLIRNVVEYDPAKEWRVYIDIKDTKSSAKVHKLREVLKNCFHDYSGLIISRIQQIRSDESEIMQFTDFILGAVVYATRKENGSVAKLAVVKRIQEHLRESLCFSTAPWESKFNLFHFRPRKG
jgi:hypothetical protein